MSNIFQKYIAYLKDNPQGYWFKRKVFGWGWTPATWQGWLVMVIFVTAVILFGFDLAAIPEPTSSDFLIFFTKIIVAIAIIIFIAYWKGEKPKWQWGIPKNDSPTQ